MKTALVSAALVGLMLAPAAYAQVTCSNVTRLLSEAQTDFEDITDDEIDDDYYEASYWIGDADECTIDYSLDSVYTCTWVYSSYSSAQAEFNSDLSSVSSCLSGWSTKAVSPDATATDGYRTLGGTRFVGSGTYIDLEWVVELEEHTDSEGLHYHVWVDLAYLWF